MNEESEKIAAIYEEYVYMYSEYAPRIRREAEELQKLHASLIEVMADFKANHSYEDEEALEQIWQIREPLSYQWRRLTSQRYERLKLLHEVEYKMFKEPSQAHEMTPLLGALIEWVKWFMLYPMDDWLLGQGVSFDSKQSEITRGEWRILEARNALANAPDRKHALTAITKCLTAAHHNGAFAEDYFHLSIEQLTSLSNLNHKQWDKELRDEFPIRY